MDRREIAKKKVSREKKTLPFPQQKQTWGRRIYKQTAEPYSKVGHKIEAREPWI